MQNILYLILIAYFKHLNELSMAVDSIYAYYCNLLKILQFLQKVTLVYRP